MNFDDINLAHYQPDMNKLQMYGFRLDNETYKYRIILKDQPFELQVSISPEGVINTELTDLNAGEIYTLHLNKSVTGAFTGKIRQAYSDILLDIIATCFEKNIFKADQAKKIIHYVREQYGIEFEYLWDKFPENAVARRKDNNKWFAALLTVERAKLGLAGQGKIEVLDLKMRPTEKNIIVDNINYLPGYHMNKNHWFTICLDGRVSDSDIIVKLAESYLLAE